MSLSKTTLGSLIDSTLSGKGANGSKRTDFSNAVAAGVVTYLTGKTFQTADVGSGSGGSGIGTGITGLSATRMAAAALGAMPSQGSKAPDLMNSIMSAVVTHLGTATLITTNPSVGTGSGTIVVGSIAVVADDMASSILKALESAGAKGSKRSALATAIATGICTEIKAHGTGTVAISGSGGSASAGSGTGTLS